MRSIRGIGIQQSLTASTSVSSSVGTPKIESLSGSTGSRASLHSHKQQPVIHKKSRSQEDSPRGKRLDIIV